MASLAAGSLISAQAESFSAADAMSAESDLALCDTSSAGFTLDLPGVGAYIGKPYSVKVATGSNAVTVRGYGGTGTIDGAASISVAAGEAMTFVASAATDAGVVTWQVLSQTLTAGGDPTAIHDDVAGEIAAITLKAVPVAADELLIEDSAAAYAKKSITIGTIPVAQAQVTRVVSQPAADAAVELDATIGGVQLSVAGAVPVAITTNANCFSGQVVHLFALSVAGGGSYTLPLDVGTLTLDATSEGAIVMFDGTDWVCVGLSGGATIV